MCRFLFWHPEYNHIGHSFTSSLFFKTSSQSNNRRTCLLTPFRKGRRWKTIKRDIATARNETFQINRWGLEGKACHGARHGGSLICLMEPFSDALFILMIHFGHMRAFFAHCVSASVAKLFSIRSELIASENGNGNRLRNRTILITQICNSTWLFRNSWISELKYRLQAVIFLMLYFTKLK